jgi:rhamnosyl/mannosyltransferase
VLHEPHPWAAVAIWLRCRARHLIIWHHSDILRPWWASFTYGWLQRSLYRRAACVIVASRALGEHSSVVPRARRIAVIPFGIDVERFARLDEPQRQLAARLRNGATRPTALVVGRLVYYKGIDVLVRAAAHCNVALRIVGDGPEEPALRRLVASYRMEDRVEFVTNVPDAELPAYYHSADMFVLPSTHRTETFGIVQIEAMAAGLPVVSTKLPTGVPWVNQDQVTGLVVDPGDPEALARAIQSLADDPARRQTLGEAGRSRARLVFSRERMLRTFTALVEEVAAG